MTAFCVVVEERWGGGMEIKRKGVDALLGPDHHV